MSSQQISSEFPFPPRRLEDLYHWAGPEGDRVLGKRARAALTSMLEAPHRAAVESISEIASKNSVDPSTLTRLGKRLGFRGFIEMQDLFRDHVAQRAGYYSDRTQQLLTSYPQGGPALARELADEESKNILDTLKGLSEDDLDRAVKLLINARRIYVIGLRASFAAAHFLGYHLGFLGREVTTLGGAGLTIAEDLARLREDDVLVAISFRPYTNLTLAACQSARAVNVPVVAITDVPSSPIAQVNAASVTMCTHSPVYFNAALSSVFLAEVLLSAMARELGDDAVNTMVERERLLRGLNIEAE